jgi:hypothetical protein
MPLADIGVMATLAGGRRSGAGLSERPLFRPGGLDLGGVDAVIAIAERLNVATVATLDRRDFTVARPRHVKALTLIPE